MIWRKLLPPSSQLKSKLNIENGITCIGRGRHGTGAMSKETGARKRA
jgi:hypothetical protein